MEKGDRKLDRMWTNLLLRRVGDDRDGGSQTGEKEEEKKKEQNEYREEQEQGIKANRRK